MRRGADGRTFRELSWSIVAAGLLAMGASSSALAEEGTVQALAPWQGSGQVFVVVPEKVMILANYTGILYFQARTGALDAALMVCPAVQVLDTKSREVKPAGTVPSRTAMTTSSTPSGSAPGSQVRARES